MNTATNSVTKTKTRASRPKTSKSSKPKMATSNSEINSESQTMDCTSQNHNSLIACVRLWEDQQKHRIRVGNLIGAVERAGAAIPTELQNNLERLKESEDGIEKLIQREWKKHPLAPWAKGIKGLGDHSIAILVAMLDGDPYIAHPKRWVKTGQVSDETQKASTGSDSDHGSDDTQDSAVADDTSQSHDDTQSAPARKLVSDPPFTRTPAQLWQYCGVGKPGRRKPGMSQDEALHFGKPLVKARLRLIAESFLKSGNDTYRAIYDSERAKVLERNHAVPCPQCGKKGKPAPELSPWRPGHQHAHALRVVAKRFLLDLWLQAKVLQQVEDSRS